jgi:hypothetical protein
MSPPLTRAVVLAERPLDPATVGRFSFRTFPLLIDCAEADVERELSEEARKEIDKEVRRRGLIHGNLIYHQRGRRRAIDLETGLSRRADTRIPSP